MNSYSDEHFNYLKRILDYLFHTKHLKLTYSCLVITIILECLVDADWASDKLDRKSVSENEVKLFGNAILWSSKKQTSIAPSSTESEYISLSSLVRDSLFWILEILKDFKVHVSLPIIIYGDNQSVISVYLKSYYFKKIQTY